MVLGDSLDTGVMFNLIHLSIEPDSECQLDAGWQQGTSETGILLADASRCFSLGLCCRLQRETQVLDFSLASPSLWLQLLPGSLIGMSPILFPLFEVVPPHSLFYPAF